jgi:hypothetical protein
VTFEFIFVYEHFNSLYMLRFLLERPDSHLFGLQRFLSFVFELFVFMGVKIFYFFSVSEQFKFLLLKVNKMSQLLYSAFKVLTLLCSGLTQTYVGRNICFLGFRETAKMKTDLVGLPLFWHLKTIHSKRFSVHLCLKTVSKLYSGKMSVWKRSINDNRFAYNFIVLP